MINGDRNHQSMINGWDPSLSHLDVVYDISSLGLAWVVVPSCDRLPNFYSIETDIQILCRNKEARTWQQPRYVSVGHVGDTAACVSVVHLAISFFKKFVHSLQIVLPSM